MTPSEVVTEARYHVPRADLDPSWRGASEGRVHLHVVRAFQNGRFWRNAGECLCSKRRGSMERPPFGTEWRCERCAVVAERHGIAWPK